MSKVDETLLSIIEKNKVLSLYHEYPKNFETRNAADISKYNKIVKSIHRDIDYLIQEIGKYKESNYVHKLEKANDTFETILKITDIENNDVGKIHTNLQWIRNITLDALRDIK